MAISTSHPSLDLLQASSSRPCPQLSELLRLVVPSIGIISSLVKEQMGHGSGSIAGFGLQVLERIIVEQADETGCELRTLLVEGCRDGLLNALGAGLGHIQEEGIFSSNGTRGKHGVNVLAEPVRVKSVQ